MGDETNGFTQEQDDVAERLSAALAIPPEPPILPPAEFAAVKAVAEAIADAGASGAESLTAVPSVAPGAILAAPVAASVPEAAVQAALAAVPQWYRERARESVQHYPSHGLVGAMIAAALSALPADGELVRQAWVSWALEQPDVAGHPNWLKPWAELDDRDREADDRIYSTVAVKAVRDAGLRNEALELLAFTLGVHRDRIFDAFRVAIHYQEYEARKEPYRVAEKALRAALEALGGSDEKGADRA